MFEEIYNTINAKIQKKEFKEAFSLLKTLEKSINEKKEKLYFYMLKINILSVLGKKEPLFIAYKEFIYDFKNSKEKEELYYVAFAYFNMALEYTKLEEIEETISIYTEMIEVFKDSNDEKILELLAKAMINKASRLNDILKLDEALIIYEEVYKRFSSYQGEIFKQAAISLNNKLAIISSLDDDKKTKKLCEFIIKELSSHNDEMIKNIVSSAEVIKDKEKFNNSF